MKYSIRVSEVKENVRQQSENPSNLRGFATLVVGDVFKISNIAILENSENNLFVSMPRYKVSNKDENGSIRYKDVCNPITKEFREELYGNILVAYDKAKGSDKVEEMRVHYEKQVPEFSVSVVLLEKEGSNIGGLARVYFENCFIVNNVSILKGKEDSLFVVMPSYRTKQVDGNSNPIYQDICYPVTQEFREKLYGELISSYHVERDKVKTKRQGILEQSEETNHLIKRYDLGSNSL